MISLIEQEICTQASGFIGSAISTWSLVVQRKRLAEKRIRKLSKKWGNSLEKSSLDSLIVESLIDDDYNAGVICEEESKAGNWHKGTNFNSPKVDGTKWLDNIACEGQLSKGRNLCDVGVCL